jgi:exodeoxyribonuclease VII large subunit
MASLSYKSVLQRGFALVRDEAERPVHAASAVRPGQDLSVEFADGRIKVRERGGPKQGSLF